MTITKDMEKDFKFLALYSYAEKKQMKKTYSNRIFWNKKILFAICKDEKNFIWTETEENPEGFSVWEVQENKFVKLEEGVKDIYNIYIKSLINAIFKKFSNFNFEFTFCWDKTIPLPIKSCSPKSKRLSDKSYFDFNNNELIVKFNENDYLREVVKTYGDFFSNMYGDIPKNFGLPFWVILELIKHTKDKIKVKIGSAGSSSQFCKMSSGKWNIISISL